MLPFYAKERDCRFHASERSQWASSACASVAFFFSLLSTTQSFGQIRILPGRLPYSKANPSLTSLS